MLFFRRKRSNSASDNTENPGMPIWTSQVFLMIVTAVLVVGVVTLVSSAITDARNESHPVSISAIGEGSYQEASVVTELVLEPMPGPDEESPAVDSALSDALRRIGYIIEPSGEEYIAQGIPATKENAVGILEASGFSVSSESLGRRDERRSESSAFVFAYADAVLSLESIADSMGLRDLEVTDADTLSIRYDGEGTTYASVRVTGNAVPR